MTKEPVDNKDDEADEATYRPAYLRQWRYYRGKQWGRRGGRVTLAELAETTGLSEGFLSQIENGDRDGSRKTLEKLARALRCSSGELLNIDPLSEGALMEIWEQLLPSEQAQGIELLKALPRARR